jgi:hypothetical protein
MSVIWARCWAAARSAPASAALVASASTRSPSLRRVPAILPSAGSGWAVSPLTALENLSLSFLSTGSEPSLDRVDLRSHGRDAHLLCRLLPLGE